MKKCLLHEKRKVRMTCVGDKLLLGYAFKYKGSLVIYGDHIRDVIKRSECVSGTRKRDE